MPLPINAGLVEHAEPAGLRALLRIADLGLAATGPDHMVVVALPRPIGHAGIKHGQVSKSLAGSLLTAEPVLQQQQPTAGVQPRGYAFQCLGNRPRLGCDDETGNRFVGLGCFRRYAVALQPVALFQYQLMVLRPPSCSCLWGAQDQAAINAGPCEPGSPQQAEAAATENMQRFRQAGESALR